jgi:hypothetical protein
MSLFDQIDRAEIRARRQNEGTFDYMNRSARPGICAVRELLDSWFEHLPENARADIRARFRSRDEVQHQSAWFEIFWHELLRCNGYQLDVHPPLANVRTSPDFLAKREGQSVFYLEATLAMPAADLAADRRLAELHDTLDRMDSPDYFLEVQYRGSAEGNIRGRLLRERIEEWLEGLNFDDISRMYQNQEYGGVPTFTWDDQGLSLTLTPIPKGPQFRGQGGARPVGAVVPMEMRMLRTHDDIRAAIEGKATKYGALDLPLVVAVNILDDFCDDVDIWNALFGEEQLVAYRQADGQWREQWGPRVPNGVWRGRCGARNRTVSAVSITHQLSPTNLRNRSVELIHNPWADHPLSPDALPLAQRSISPDGHIQRRDGSSAADVLQIPEPWPVPD